MFSFGDAASAGSTGAMRLNQPIAGVFTFGDEVPFLGSTGGIALNRPVVAISTS